MLLNNANAVDKSLIKEEIIINYKININKMLYENGDISFEIYDKMSEKLIKMLKSLKQKSSI